VSPSDTTVEDASSLLARWAVSPLRSETIVDISYFRTGAGIVWLARRAVPRSA
jgi:hypothetical protein